MGGMREMHLNDQFSLEHLAARQRGPFSSTHGLVLNQLFHSSQLAMPFPPISPIVQELVAHLNSHPDIRSAFLTAFGNAYIGWSQMLDVFQRFNIHSADDYIRYMDDFVYWIPEENCTGTNVYDHLCLSYFIFDTPPLILWQSPIHPSTQAPYTWLSDWIVRYAQEMGRWMDMRGSITPDSLLTFRKAKGYDLDQYIEPVDGWKTFNEFFARHVKPDRRPVAPDTDNAFVITSPADCKYAGQWPVDGDAKIDMKGLPWTIGQLLDDSKYAPCFAGGVFTHSFLGPYDYHRLHAPVSGTVIEAKVIPGLCYLEVVAEPDPVHPGRMHLAMHRPLRPSAATRGVIPLTSVRSPFGLLAPNTAGYQFLQARGLILIDSPDIGLVAVLPIGMCQVSSVKLSVKAGDQLNKGDEIAYFQLGGSDIVMVFQKDAKVSFDAQENMHYNVGTRVATSPRLK